LPDFFNTKVRTDTRRYSKVQIHKQGKTHERSRKQEMNGRKGGESGIFCVITVTSTYISIHTCSEKKEMLYLKSLDVNLSYNLMVRYLVYVPIPYC
jgi:hypothetical protein